MDNITANANTVPEIVILDASREDKENKEKPSSAANLVSPSFDLLKSCHQVALDKWAKKSKQRLSDLNALLPAAVTKDRQFVTAIHAQLEKRVKSELEEALDERAKDWGIREKLAEIDAIVVEQEKQLEGSRPQAW